MKKIALIFIFSLLSMIHAESKTAMMNSETKEVFAKITKALNITPKVLEIKSMTQVGKILMPAMKIQGLVSVKTKGDKILIESKMAGMVETQAIDGDKGWASSMSTGVRELSVAEVLTLQGDSLKYIFNQEAFYDTIKLEGKEIFNKQECLKIVFTKEGLDPSIQYFDPKTFLPIGEIQVLASPMGKMTATIIVQKLVKHELGFLYPKNIEQSIGPMKMTITIDSFKMNIPLSDDIFKKPAQ